jgi:hypothetical protein
MTKNFGKERRAYPKKSMDNSEYNIKGWRTTHT